MFLGVIKTVDKFVRIIRSCGDAMQKIAQVRTNFRLGLNELLVVATIVLSSTAGAAEHWGSLLGEYVEAGEHRGQPYYRQRDTVGSTETFLKNEEGNWCVSYTLGGSSVGLYNYENKWVYWDGKTWNNDDTTLTLDFTALSPCQLVRVSGKGDVVKKQSSNLGDYRSGSMMIPSQTEVMPLSIPTIKLRRTIFRLQL